MSILEKLPTPLGVILFLPLLPLFALLALFSAGSRRRLPPEPKAETVPGTAFVRPVEHIDGNEDEMFERISRRMVNAMAKKYPKGSGEQHPAVFDDGHGLGTAMLRGTLNVSQEQIDALPKELRVGLFAQPGVHDVVTRFNAIDTTQGPFDGQRVAIKVRRDDAEMDIVLAAYDAQQPWTTGFFINDATDMVFLTGMPRTIFSPNGLRQMYRLIIKGVGKLRGVRGDQGLFGTHYSSLTAYRLGPAGIKRELAPKQTHDLSTGEGAHAQRMLAASEEFCDSRDRAEFELKVRVATADGTVGPIGCCERPDVHWDLSKCPSFSVANLVFEIPSWASIVETHGAPAAWSNQLRFNIGNTIDEHAPLGSSNRLRKCLYVRHGDARREQFYGTPAETKPAPFDSPSS